MVPQVPENSLPAAIEGFHHTVQQQFRNATKGPIRRKLSESQTRLATQNPRSYEGGTVPHTLVYALMPSKIS